MHKRLRIATFPLTVGAAAMSLSTPLLAQSAHLVDLGANITGYAINNAGQVAFSGGIYTNGTVTILPVPVGTSSATPFAINSKGDVVGAAAMDLGALPFVYTNGVSTVVNVADADTGISYDSATGINASGAVIYSYQDRIFYEERFAVVLYPNGTASSIAPFYVSPAVAQAVGTETIPNGINDSGLITGAADKLDSPNGPVTRHAFIYDSGTGIVTDLGVGAGYAINPSGQVTGKMYSSSADPGQAFIYSGGTSKLLGTLPGGTTSTGYAINAAGVVVGNSDLSGASDTHAFFYNGVLVDMNALISPDDPLKPYVTLGDARGINDSRMIVVNGGDSRDGKGHAYLLQGPSIDVAPGPLSFGMTAIGSTATAQRVTLTNSGTAAVTLAAPTVTGDFAQTNTCSTSLAAGASCTASVTFVPTASGTRSGALNFVVSGLGLAVPLSGSAAPAVTATLSASVTTIVTGQSVTLTWSAPNATGCTASGGGLKDNWNDGWVGSKGASGSQALPESGPPAALTFTISCTSSVSGFSAQASATVTESAPPPPRSGGGGAIDLGLLTALAGLLGLSAAGRYRAARPGK